MAVPCYIQVADVCNMFYKLPYCRRRYYATILPSSCTQSTNAIRKTIQSEKQKSRSQNSGDFVFVLIFPYTISRNFCDESQSKFIVELLHSQRKSDNFPQRHCPFRYLCNFCRHISLYDTFACLTWLTVTYYLCFRHQSFNVTFARKRLDTTNV